MEKYSSDFHEKLSGILDHRETDMLAEGATRSIDGIRRFPEERLASDYRQNFAVDVDRILHSMAYTRYIDKTQVFYLIKNDHITHRVLHVQLVSKIARTIGRFLGLNEDLIEGIALGHDIGHVPFGHDGEKILSTLCRSAGIGHFLHALVLFDHKAAATRNHFWQISSINFKLIQRDIPQAVNVWVEGFE